MRKWALVLLLIPSLATEASSEEVPPPHVVGRRPEALPLEVRVGRLLWPVLDERKAASYESAVRAGRIGGGLLRWGIKRKDAKKFIKTLRAWAADANVPFYIAVDHEGGPIFTQPELGTVFPGNMALGAAGSAGLAEKAAAASGRELSKIGVDINFAPVVDVNSNPDNPIIGIRSFGENPTSVAALSAAAVRGYLRGGVLPVAKHFPGHGDTSQDSHTTLPTVAYSRARWDMIDRPPFATAIREGVPLIMTAHISVPALGTGDLPATLSSAALRGVLRGELGFKGVVVSDSLDMGAITKGAGAGEAAVRSVLAGCDVLLTGKGDYEAVHAALMEAVHSGRLPEEILDRSVRRIRALKGRLTVKPLRGSAEDLARRIADASVTLYRNRDGLIPLAPEEGRRVLIVSFRHPKFDKAWAGFISEVRKSEPHVKTITVDAGDPDDVRESAAASDLLIVGTFQWGGGVRDSQKKILKALRDSRKPLIQISLLNPYEVRDYPENRTVLLTYGPTRWALAAAVRVIYGRSIPRGRPPVTLDAPSGDMLPSEKQ